MNPRLPLLLALALCGCASHDFSPPTLRNAPVPPPMKADYTLTKAVTYTPAGWPQALPADLYQPAGTGPFPAVVVAHGGGWNGRDRGDMDGISKKLARRGFVVLNIEYRLAPRFLYPASLEDTQQAVRWLRSKAAGLKIDPQRIAGWGYSAGAHLVALAATAGAGSDAALQAVVAGGMPSDFPHYPVSPIISKYMGGTLAEKRESWIEASPARRVTKQTPPMFVYHGSWDRLVYPEDARTMKAALDAQGVPNELYIARGLGHIGTFLLGFGAEGAGIDFLAQTLSSR